MRPLSTLLLVLTSVVTLAAPVPKIKAPEKPITSKPIAFVGVWQMTWGGGTGQVELYKDGVYRCDWMGQSWHGTWLVEGDINTGNAKFVCKERRDASPGETLQDCWLNWTITNVKHDKMTLLFIGNEGSKVGTWRLCLPPGSKAF